MVCSGPSMKILSQNLSRKTTTELFRTGKVDIRSRCLNQ